MISLTAINVQIITRLTAVDFPEGVNVHAFLCCFYCLDAQAFKKLLGIL